MKLGEIKIEALKLMFTSYDRDISIESLSQLYYEDDNIKSYLYNMNGSINRAIDRIVVKGILPYRTITFAINDGERGARKTKYNLNNINNDDGTKFYKLVRVVFESGDIYESNKPYLMEGNGNLILNNLNGQETYTIIYLPQLERVSATTIEEKELPIPNDIASFIPYYIKAELFEEDEPSLASLARNIFEQSLQDRIYNADNNQDKVACIYQGNLL